jgi:hypothetical protein
MPHIPLIPVRLVRASNQSKIVAFLSRDLCGERV